MPLIELLPHPAQLRAIHRAVAEFVRLTGPLANRRLKAAGGVMTPENVMQWGNIHLVASAIEGALFPRDKIIPPPGIGDRRRKASCTSGWPCDVHSALQALTALMETLLTRWDVPEIAAGEGYMRGINATHTGADGVSVELRPPLPPTVEDAERETLEWVLDVLAHALRWLETAPLKAGPRPLRLVWGADDADPEPTIELSEADIAEDFKERKQFTRENLVRFMMKHGEATLTDAGEAIYEDPYATQDRFRKTVDRVNRHLELRRSRIRYKLTPGSIIKETMGD